MSHLPIKWAERADRLFITVEASNATDVTIHFTEKTIAISGKGITAKSSDVRELKDEIALLKEIKPSESTYKVLGVSIQICAIKKEEGYWNKLVDQPAKATKNWLSADWNLWKDEDDEDDKADNADGFGGYGDMSSMLGGMGGMGGMADMMGGMGGMGGMNIEDMPDSDDEDEEAADLSDLKPE
eukprot:gene6147-4426_t